MFEFVRSHPRLFQGILVLLIFPSFVFFGIEGYTQFHSEGNADVAKVDGRAITRGELDATHQRNIERLRQQMPNIDVKLLDTPQMKRETLDGLIRDRVLLAAADQMHLGVSDDRLQRLFVSDPQFAPFRNPDGSVNRDVLASQGMNSQMFEQRLRQDFSLRQVLQGIGGTVMATPAVSDPGIDAILQRREVKFQHFDPKDYSARVQPTDAQIEAYYKAHEAQFLAPDQARIDYVVLSLSDLAKGITVPEADLRRYYDENAARYTTAEQRRASHILIKADKDMSAAEHEKAKAKAEALLEQVRKNPGAFAELAKKNSDDPGSAVNGGDLGFFDRGAMVKPFEDAAFAMKPGEISNLVESDFGYHIIELTGVRGGDKKSFESVRPQIEDDVKKQLAQKRFAEAAEQFTNTVYEQSDSLQPVIDRFKLEKKTATVQRTPAPGATGVLASAKFLDAVFGNDALHNKRNTDAVEVGPNELASAHVLDYTAAHTRTLAEVKDQVRERLIAEQAAALAKADGQALLARLQKGEDVSLPKDAVISRSSRDTPRAVVKEVLSADAGKLPVTLGVDLGADGYEVLRVVKILPRDTAVAAAQDLQAQFDQALSNAESQAYYAALKERFKVQIKTEALAAAGAASATAR